MQSTQLVVTLSVPELRAMFLDVLREAGALNATPEKKPESERYLSVTEAAKFLHIATVSMYRRIAEKAIPTYKEGQKHLILESDLVAYLNENRLKSGKELLSEAGQTKKRENERCKVTPTM